MGRIELLRAFGTPELTMLGDRAGLFWVKPGADHAVWLAGGEQDLVNGDPYVGRPDRDMLISLLVYVAEQLQDCTERENTKPHGGPSIDSLKPLLRKHLDECADCRKSACDIGYVDVPEEKCTGQPGCKAHPTMAAPAYGSHWADSAGNVMRGERPKFRGVLNEEGVEVAESGPSAGRNPSTIGQKRTYRLWRRTPYSTEPS
jgi:hypothetical protein